MTESRILLTLVAVVYVQSNIKVNIIDTDFQSKKTDSLYLEDDISCISISSVLNLAKLLIIWWLMVMLIYVFVLRKW